ncbi:MAG TPA: HlyD family efflux transporter periplasmic adaptor subunit [Bacteroidales bacterium]|nr:HlyD family efflux transporter periplasmic adaptor subunit [Bacteroidales bacterium]
MEKKKPDIIYSEPVREIMGNPPRVILRYGTTIIFAIFVLFILFAWLFRYPDVVSSPVEITTENPPVTLVSKGTYRIRHLFVANGAVVDSGKQIGVMESVADIREEKLLHIFTDSCHGISDLASPEIPALVNLGELQGWYSALIKTITDLGNFKKNDYYGQRIRTIRDELNGLRKYRQILIEKEKMLSENYALEKSSFGRDSGLNGSKFLAQAALEKSKKALNTEGVTLKDVQLEISAKTIDIAGYEQQINELTSTRDEERDKLISAGDEALNNLKAQIKIWENNYLLISPIRGTVTFTKYWSENQTVAKDEPVLSIVPSNQGKYIGRIYLKMERSGKVEAGATVNIKLTGFPYLEFGMIRGMVKSKSLVPDGNNYLIEVSLPGGLKSLYGNQLVFTQNMQGTAEILTNNISLLQKIFYPFRYLLTKNRK